MILLVKIRFNMSNKSRNITILSLIQQIIITKRVRSRRATRVLWAPYSSCLEILSGSIFPGITRSDASCMSWGHGCFWEL